MAIPGSVHAYVAKLHMRYIFAHIHQALHVTPAMEAGVSDHVRMPEKIVSLLP